MITPAELKQKQSMSLGEKIKESQEIIKIWHEYWDGMVHVSFSGGKDSTVLLDVVRSIYPNTPAVFVDTGLEFPEIREFVKTIDNVVWLRPKIPFHKVIKKYGYPVPSKEQAMAVSRYKKTKDPMQKFYRLNGYPNGKKGMISKKWQFLINAPFDVSEKCCVVLKENPALTYSKKTNRKPFIGTMVGESNNRMLVYLKTGCNAFGSSAPKSTPISFWTEEDVWEYIHTKNLPYSKIYDMGETRTGCMFCMFGIMRDTPGNNRFQRMARTHPKHYDYCINKLGLGAVLDYVGVNYKPDPHPQLDFNDLKAPREE